MAQSGRSWNDPKSARARGGGSAPGNSSGTPAPGPASPPGAASGNSNRASWRDKSTPTVTQRGKKSHWLVSQTDNPNRFRYRAKLAIAVAALVVLFGSYLVYVFFGPRNTPLLLVGVLDYAAPLPPNAFTFEDFDRFRAAFVTEDGAGAENIRVEAVSGVREWKNGKAPLGLDPRRSRHVSLQNRS